MVSNEYPMRRLYIITESLLLNRFLPFGSSGEDSQDLLRCFGLVYDLPAPTNSSGVLILNRITSIPSYLAINKYCITTALYVLDIYYIIL